MSQMKTGEKRRTGTMIYSTFRGLPPAAPAFEELPEHPSIQGARMLPRDGTFTIDGGQWTVRGCSAVALGPNREPDTFVEPGPSVDVTRPAFVHTINMTISIGVATRSVIEESDERVVVMDGFGPVRGGSA